jgi:hypothetical protein
MSSRRLIWLACAAVALLHVAYIAFIHCAHAPGTFTIRDLEPAFASGSSGGARLVRGARS